MSNTPKVSIGMPIYNGEQFLEESLDSLIHQSFTDFEIIISDNASTDRTPEICRDYASKDPRIRYTQNNWNLGAAENYNRVFDLSNGCYFKWAAADDVCTLEFLKRCIEVLDNDHECILAYPRTKIIDQNSQAISSYRDELDLSSPSPLVRFNQALLMIAECNAVFGLVRSDVLRQTARIGNYQGSDVVLLAELSLYGRFHEIPEYLFLRRHHPAASSANRALEAQQEFFDPKTRGRITLPQGRHIVEHLCAVKRSPLSPADKLCAFNLVMRKARWKRCELLAEVGYACKRCFSEFRIASVARSITRYEWR